MGAIVKPAVLGNLKNFGKEMCHFVGIEIDSSEALYARSVDNVPTLWQGYISEKVVVCMPLW